MKTIYIKDFDGHNILSITYDQTLRQISAIKVPKDIPSSIIFYFSDTTSQTVNLRYYVKGYLGFGDTQSLLRVTYPKGELTYLPDIATDFTIYVMTTNPSNNFINLKISGQNWHIAYRGDLTKFFISSEYNPLLRLITSIDNVELNLPLNNQYKIWGVSDTSTTQPDIYADILTAVSFASGTLLNVIFTTVTTDAIYMTLYKNNAPSTVVNKTSYLTQVEQIAGTLRKQCSVTSPIITIQHEGKPEANYCYIDKFKRYYYIQDTVNIATDLWELYMKSDPLFSFRSEFLNSVVAVLRATSSSLYNRMLHDNLLPVENKVTRTRTYSDKDPLIPSWANVNDTEAHIILSTFSDTNVQTYIPTPDESTASPVKGMGNYYPRGAQCFAITRSGLNSLARIFANGGPNTGGVLEMIFGTDDLTPYILSLRAYPLDFRILLDGQFFKSYTYGTPNAAMALPCGKLKLEREIATLDREVVDGYPLIPIDPEINFGKITIPTPSSFLETEPNAKAILHLPYIGDIDFNLTEYAGITITIKYALDITTGNVKAIIRNNANSEILYSQSGKMGVEIPMILNNMTKGENERTGQAIKLGTSIVSVAAGAIVSAAASPIAGGLVGGATAMLGNTIATPFFNTPNQSKQFSGDDMTEFFTDNKCYLEIIKPVDNYTYFYAQQYGVPSNAIVNLSGYTGTGFVVVSPNSRITQPVDSTLNEYEEICSALKSGVVI